MTNRQISYKIVLLGNSNVGKSTIIHRYFLNDKNMKLSATISANFYSIQSPDPHIKLAIWDTSGSERYRSICPIYYRGSSACIAVFDVTNKQSFNAIDEWLTSYKNAINTENPLVLLLANKIDYPIDQWQVTYQDIQALAKSYDCELVLTSGIYGTNMDDFHSAMKKLYIKIRRYNEARDLNSISINYHELPKVQEESCYSSCATPTQWTKSK